jgi:hypothetical protein
MLYFALRANINKHKQFQNFQTNETFFIHNHILKRLLSTLMNRIN